MLMIIHCLNISYFFSVVKLYNSKNTYYFKCGCMRYKAFEDEDNKLMMPLQKTPR